MKLIDLDKALVEAEDECRMSDDWKVSHEMMNVFKYQPTVKAIPIEWIEEWLDKTTGTRDGEDISQLPEQLKFAIEMINLMEMDWEKENEKNID